MAVFSRVAVPLHIKGVMEMPYPCPQILESDRLISFDIETTGLSPIYNNIIELGVVEMAGGEIKTRYSRLFGGGRSSVYTVRQVHHIPDSERRGLPTFGEKARQIAGWFGTATLVSHNGTAFDLPFIQERMRAAGVQYAPIRHFDTLRIARRLDAPPKDAPEAIKRAYRPKFASHRLGDMCAHYGIAYGDQNHRGLADCECTLALLFALCAEFGTAAVLGIS